ncbi:hypothetical protein CPB83DRAFT_812776 [Crepidotus variabilis]|uniref:Uncharacterized protein n=1 Tax=Crepidotus variabilis TaxID=179855 RepID=A0A9P6EHU6_9AGAR|nr:hypothetical protein CPB83DRAFT_812776 [Crepidotus variabilis]
MSYATVAATNAPPPSEQPHADPALLNTTASTAPLVADDAAKVNVVAPEFLDDYRTTYSEADKISEQPRRYAAPTVPAAPTASHSDKHSRAKKRVHEAEEEGYQLWETAKQYLFRPGVAGGLIGIVNIGVFATIGRTFYTQPDLRRDGTALSTAVIGSLALLSAEGYAAEQYRQTPQGRDEEKRAKKEGALIYRHLHEQVMRPGVLGGLVGILNTAILGTLGYAAYTHWDRPWDRRVVSAISVGMLTLWGGEGVLADRYIEEQKRSK